MSIMRATHLMALVALTSCMLSTGPADSVDLQVTVEPSSFRLGDTATVTVTLTNRRAETVAFDADYCPVYFAVFDEGSREVAPAGLGCPLVRARVLLNAGEEQRWEFTWLGEPWKNYFPGDEPYPTEFLEPGAYTVRGVLALSQTEKRYSESVDVELLPRD